MSAEPKRPSAGQEVRVRWMDSGADSGEDEGSIGPARTWGEVFQLAPDPEVHDLLCFEGRPCRCDVLVLSMCRSEDGSRSSRGYIWWECVISVTILQDV